MLFKNELKSFCIMLFKNELKSFCIMLFKNELKSFYIMLFKNESKSFYVKCYFIDLVWFTIDDMLFWLDQTWANKLLGYDLDDLLRTNCYMLIHLIIIWSI